MFNIAYEKVEQKEECLKLMEGGKEPMKMLR